MRTGVLQQDAIAEMDKLIHSEVHEAFRFAEESPFPDQGEAFMNIYKQ